MKNLIRNMLVLCVSTFILSSCGQSNNEGRMIPASALFVTQINLKALGNKVAWNEIKQTSFYKDAFAQSDKVKWRKKVLENPSESGIDFEKGIIFFVDKGAGNELRFVVTGTLKDEKKFEDFNKNAASASSIKKSGVIRLLSLKNNVVGWSDNHFAYVMNSQLNSSDLNFGDHNFGEFTGNGKPQNKETLDAYCTKLFSLSPDSSLSQNKKFSQLMSEEGDLRIWQNTEEMAKSTPDMGILNMMKLDVFFKGNISTFTIKFNEGKIEINQKGYAGKELTDFLNKYKGTKINTGMIQNIPSQDVVGLLALNFNPEGIKELIKLTGMDGMANMFLQQSGFNLDDISKANNGNLLFALTDLKIKKDSLLTQNNDDALKKPEFNYLFAMGINDKASFEKINNALKNLAGRMVEDSSITLAMNDNTFAISNSRTFANTYLNGNSKNNFEFIDKIKGHPMGFYLDLHQIISVLSSIKTDLGKEAIVKQSLNLWDNIIATGGDIEDGVFTMHTQINLMDKGTNSFKQMTRYFDELAKINKAHRKSTHNGRNLDSLLTPPPIDTVKVK